MKNLVCAIFVGCSCWFLMAHLVYAQFERGFDLVYTFCAVLFAVICGFAIDTIMKDAGDSQ